MVKDYGGHFREVRCAAFSGDGNQLVSGSGDMTVRRWDVESREEVGRYAGHNRPVLAVAFALSVPSKVLPVENIGDIPTVDTPRIRHEHGAWTIVASPLILGKIDSDVADGSDATGEFGASALVSRRLSRSAMLDFGMLVARARYREESSYSYLWTITPKVIVAKSQRDRFFAGLGLAILALDQPGKDLRWGLGPQATLGVDIEMTRATCFCVAGEFGNGRKACVRTSPGRRRSSTSS